MSIPPTLNDGPRSGAARAFGMSFASHDDVNQEQPTMRSVAIMQPPSFAIGEGMLSFGKAPPLGISCPPIGLKPLSKPGGLSRSSDSFGFKQEWNGATAPSIWRVRCEDLELVPEDFPLERTHRTIPSATATEVSQRISDALRCLSVEAEYDCQRAKAKCKTNDLVSFRIRLYAGGENGVPVVVEVQRRSGSASSFMKTCRAILNAAEGKMLDCHSSTMKKQLPSISQTKCLQSIISARAPEENLSVAELDKVMEMLRSRQRDTNVLALENLRFLTDPTKTSISIAIRVSKCVALGDEKYDLREEIQELTERDVFVDGAEDEAGLARHSDNLRHLAVCVLANALGVCAKDGCLASAVDAEPKWFLDHLIPSLIDEVKRAETSACIAYEATCCLYSLMSCSIRVRELFIHQCGVVTLEAAHEEGKSRHELLAEETMRCLKVLKA